MQDQPNYLAQFAEDQKADEKLAELIERAVEKQLAPILERLERIERALSKAQK